MSHGKDEKEEEEEEEEEEEVANLLQLTRSSSVEFGIGGWRVVRPTGLILQVSSACGCVGSRALWISQCASLERPCNLEHQDPDVRIWCRDLWFLCNIESRTFIT